MKILLFLVVFINSLAASYSHAAIITPANCTQTAVQNAIWSSADGDTVSVPAGTCTWNGLTLDNGVGTNLLCATPGTCNIDVGQSGMPGGLSGNNIHNYRISGFNFTGGGIMLWFYGAGTLHNMRIDHNTFATSTNTNAIYFGEQSTIASFYGVVDHNTMTSPGNSMLVNVVGLDRTTPLPSPLGTANNLFVEDNTLTVTAIDNLGEGCMDSAGNAAIVWRHNTTTNCLITAHSVLHGGGPQNIELYDNFLTLNSGSAGSGFEDGNRLFHHQGAGEFIAFNNQFTAYIGKSTNSLAIMYYRSDSTNSPGDVCDGTNSKDQNRSPSTTYHGYPCWHQPGRDFDFTMKPIYIWNNRWSDTQGMISLSPEDYGGFFTSHMVANRDFYNPVGTIQTSSTSPFNGTVGTGFGTLANRPTTCTTTSESLDAGHGGVGYFATDTNTLYQCSSTNTWTTFYVPYTYPHPLTATGGGSPPVVNGLTCSPTSIQSLSGTTNCTATIASGTPTTWAWSFTGNATSQCSTADISNPAAIGCLFGGTSTICALAHSADGDSNNFCTSSGYLTSKYRQATNFQAH
jgi:hypothetical protein